VRDSQRFHLHRQPLSAAIRVPARLRLLRGGSLAELLRRSGRYQLMGEAVNEGSCVEGERTMIPRP
jgi:hypothetical protein